MELTPGKWRLLGGGTELLGFAYSLFFDQDLSSASCVLWLKPAWIFKQRTSVARVRVRLLQQAPRRDGARRPIVRFEGTVLEWDGRSCPAHRIEGTVSASGFEGICEIVASDSGRPENHRGDDRT
jgi:hypothetical protein